MPEIIAFRGLRYAPATCGDRYANLIAPPYDVLSADDKAELLATDDQNIVRIDLPHVPPKSAGPDEVYTQAARTLAQWREMGVLMAETEPALYVYHQRYTHAGQTYTRKKFFARMKLEPFGTGTVFPHEQTFGGPKADRLKLMTATAAQLSAVFGLYSDPDNAVSTLLDPGDRTPDIAADMDGVANRLWVCTDPTVIAAVGESMADRPVYIADGHHRYGTALNYLEQRLADDDLPADHPARYILIGLCAMEDPGAVILPTHRTLTDLGEVSAETVLDALREGVDLQPCPADLDDPQSLLSPEADADLCVYVASENKAYAGRFTQRDRLAELAADKSDAWRDLDVAYLHRFLIDECVTKRALAGREPTIHYLKAAGKALDVARDQHGIALLCKACSMGQLRAVSNAGDLMPQKSTYFYPKLATGLVINPLD